MTAVAVGAATTERLGYRPGLDGLRGVAVLLVVGAHAEMPGFRLGGAVGVEVFFVLSGFLITTLMLERGRVDLRDFYLRRARRLLPALAVLLGVVGVVAAVLGDRDTLAGVGAGVAYVANVARAQSIDLGWLNHLWSLAVEEHFYLLWPLVVMACGCRDRMVGLVAAVGAAGSLWWRFALAADGASWDRLYNGTDTRAAGILIGAVVAVLVRRGLRVPPVVGLGGLALLLGPVDLPGSEPFRFGFLAVDLAGACAIVATVTYGSRLLELRPLVWAGGVSYAAYLWHVPVLEALGGHEGLTPMETVAGFVLTGVVAAVSMRLVEARWRVTRPGADVSPRPRSAPEPVPG